MTVNVITVEKIVLPETRSKLMHMTSPNKVDELQVEVYLGPNLPRTYVAFTSPEAEDLIKSMTGPALPPRKRTMTETMAPYKDEWDKLERQQRDMQRIAEAFQMDVERKIMDSLGPSRTIFDEPIRGRSVTTKTIDDPLPPPKETKKEEPNRWSRLELA